MIALNEIVRQYPQDLQKPEFYDPMVKEYFHHHMLKTLFSDKLANRISFIGGTALRYFYNLKRFSEDLDLDCFDLSRYEFIELTDRLLREIKALGVNVVIEDKKRYSELKAFRRVFAFPGLKYQLGLSQQKEARFFIKVEAESQHFDYTPELKTIIGFGVYSPIRTMPLNILFSSKIAAALSRKKDRDFYDLAFLINFALPDFRFLKMKRGIETPGQLKEALLDAASERNLKNRREYDCEHMLFNRNDINMIRSFSDYIEHFDFNKFIVSQ